MEIRVSELRHEIVRTVKDPLVLQHLVPAFVSDDDARALKRLYHVCTERANHRLLDLLCQSEQPGKWTAFIQALHTAEYTYLAKLLQTEDTNTFNTCSKLIELFAPQIEQCLNPAELLAALHAGDVISAHDKEFICAKQTNEGAIAAAMLLLERIQIHLEPDEWYSKFLTILHVKNQKELADLIDPDFDAKSDQKRTEKETLLYNIRNSTDSDDHSASSGVEEGGTESLGGAIQACRDEIAVILPDIVQHLVPTVISQEMASRLQEHGRVDMRTSADEVLDYIINSSPSVHREFKRCLESEGYQYLARLLSNPNCKCHNKYMKKVLSLFEPIIQSYIDPAAILSLLVSEDVIGIRDKESILKAREQRGKTAAAMVMLQCVQSRLAPHEWYTKLLRILVQTNNTDVARILEPDFIEDPDNFTQKIYEEAQTPAATSLEQPEESESSHGNADAEITGIQKQKRTFLQSSDKARADLMSQKRKIDTIFDNELYTFDETVKAKIKTFEERISRIKDKIERRVDTETTTGLEAGLADVSLRDEHEDGTIITFRPSKTFTSFGEFRLTTSFVTDQQETRALSVIPKHLKENNSSSSSYLEVSGRPTKLSDNESSAGNKSEVDSETELRALVSRDVHAFCEDISYIGESKLSNVYLEIVRYNVTVDIGSLMCCDIAATHSGKELVGLSLKNKSFCRFDSVANLMNETPLAKQYHRLSRVNEHEFILISLDDAYVDKIDASSGEVSDLHCNCCYHKKAMCTADDEVFILCSGKHIHIFSQKSSTWLDPVQLTKLPVAKDWAPIHVSINKKRTNLFIAETTESVYCFDPRTGELKYSATCGVPREGMLMTRGLVCLVCLAEFVVVVHTHNSCADVYTADGWLFKDTVEHEVFSGCTLVAKGDNTNELIVVSERKAEGLDQDNEVTSISSPKNKVVLDVRRNAVHGNVGVMSMYTDARMSLDARRHPITLGRSTAVAADIVYFIEISLDYSEREIDEESD